MALRLKTQRDGKTLRPFWYGAFVDEGKQKVVTLSVKWTGTPPASGRVGDAGDEKFERSREKAEAELARFIEESKRKGRADNLTERLIESKTGKAVAYVRLDELPARWRTLARGSKPTDKHLTKEERRLQDFVAFVKARNPQAVHLYQVTEDDVTAYAEDRRKALAPHTAKESVLLANRALARFLPVGAANPFSVFVNGRATGGKGTIHRRPFTPEELRALLDAARDDDFMFPLVVCASMTGMRRGDVCGLRWESVDLSGGMVAVKTSKTEKPVEIPIFPLLRDVLEDAGPKRKGFVWPEAAKMLKDNPDGLTWRFKKLVVQALTGERRPAPSDIIPADSIEDEALDAIRRNTTEGERRDRMAEIFRRYAAGETVRQIERAVGCARATVSADLHAIQNWTGKTFMRSGGVRPDVKEQMAKLTTVESNGRARAASVLDWHALRTTWITLALSAGVPIELVKRVTGHAQVDIVLGHYFRPDREQFKAALSGALPEVLTGGGKAKRLSAGDELAALAGKVQAGTATEADRKRLRLLAAKV
ncbi:MAG TPA: tyrosine-type recombinase/integrase [Kiritimatiellia bacterium]|nr:tyrosine-type recombinase/integrase [Kiritimatiellia bacterium]